MAVKKLPLFGPDQPCSEGMYAAMLREIELASKFSSDRWEAQGWGGASPPCLQLRAGQAAAGRLLRRQAVACRYRLLLFP